MPVPQPNVVAQRPPVQPAPHSAAESPAGSTPPGVPSEMPSRPGDRAVALALGASAVVLAAALAREPRLVGGESGMAVSGVALHLPRLYVALAPWSGLLDTLGLLSVRQHEALVATTVLLVAIWRLRVARRRVAPAGVLPRTERAARHALASVAALAGIAALYAAGVLLPRPMAGLRAADPDAVLVDFHSHTDASHDGRRGFTRDANRAWHHAAGFDVAYVTDHASPSTARPAARLAAAADVSLARNGTTLLPGVEVVYRGEHVVGLGADVVAALTDGPAVPARVPPWPVLIQTIPERLAGITGADAHGDGGVLAIELAGAAPRGIEQARREHERMLRLADSLDVAVVAGSNQHGWGRTAAAWSVLRIAGWHAMTPGALDAAIQRAIRRRRRHAVRVVVRHPVPGARSAVGLALVGPAVVWTTLATQSPAERAMTLGWIWLAATLAIVGRRAGPARGVRRTTSPPETARRAA